MPDQIPIVIGTGRAFFVIKSRNTVHSKATEDDKKVR